jgi:hypothetical protein
VAANQVLHETTYDAAVARVFAAFADPDLRAKWGAPSERLAAALTGSRQCPLFAQSGHSNRSRECPLSGVKRTSPCLLLTQSGHRLISPVTPRMC